MTWTVGWRFLVPVEPLETLAAVAVVAVLFGDSAVAADHERHASCTPE